MQPRNRRQAILRAATFIEENPRLYNYKSNAHCLLAWSGYFAGIEREDGYSDTAPIEQAARHFGHDSMLSALADFAEIAFTSPDWKTLTDFTEDAKAGAAVLRLYADKHFPDSRPSAGVAAQRFLSSLRPSLKRSAPAGEDFTPTKTKETEDVVCC